MLFTNRLIWLVGTGAGLFVLAWVHPFWAWVGAFYNALLAALAVADWFASTSPAEIDVHRECEDKLSLGTQNPIYCLIRNRGKHSLGLQVKDEPPLEFDVTTRVMTSTVRPNQALRMRYEVRPPRRGDFVFGALNVRYETPLKLLVRQVRIPAMRTVKVYPNLRNIAKYNLLAKRGRLEELGIRTVRRRGQGTEFESLRDYTQDDEFRQINWKATARKGRLISQQYQIERSQTVMLAIDAGRMMAAAPSGSLSKLDWAVNAALMIAYVATRMDDRVGLVLFAGQVKGYLPPRKGKAQTYRIMEMLYGVQGERVEPDYAEAVSFLLERLDKRSLTILFTDFADQGIAPATKADSYDLVSNLFRFRPVHLVICATPRPVEIEALAEQFPENTAQVYEKAVAEQVLFDREHVLRTLTSGGIHVLDETGEELTVAALNRYLELKSRSLL